MSCPKCDTAAVYGFGRSERVTCEAGELRGRSRVITARQGCERRVGVWALAESRDDQ
jgi:aryl-alcohol dehydrogenase-like predicted oxidoreductase